MLIILTTPILDNLLFLINKNSNLSSKFFFSILVISLIYKSLKLLLKTDLIIKIK